MNCWITKTIFQSPHVKDLMDNVYKPSLGVTIKDIKIDFNEEN